MAKLTFEISLKTIRRTLALMDVEVNDELEKKIMEKEITFSEDDTIKNFEEQGKIILMAYAGIITGTVMEEEEKNNQ